MIQENEKIQEKSALQEVVVALAQQITPTTKYLGHKTNQNIFPTKTQFRKNNNNGLEENSGMRSQWTVSCITHNTYTTKNVV